MKTQFNAINCEADAVHETVDKSPVTVLDHEHLMRQTMGDEKLQHEVLFLFMAQCKECDQLLKKQISAKQMSETAHQINGCARSIGAWELASAAKKLELNPKDATLLPPLHRQIQRVIKYIQKMT
ncbi:MAG: Hpt domain-containing protein [Rhizobiaceae bacterium]|nr:Hpt domain-containing protein [Rhizobiaceae bacterium]